VVVTALLLGIIFVLAPLQLDRVGWGPVGIAGTFLAAAFFGVIARPLIGRWADPKEAERHIAWTRAAHEAMERFGTGGVYVNYLGEEGDQRVRAAYGETKYERLVSLKNRYDPENLFRCNQNIKPNGRAS